MALSIYFIYCEAIVYQKWAKTGVPVETPPDLPLTFHVTRVRLEPQSYETPTLGVIAFTPKTMGPVVNPTLSTRRVCMGIPIPYFPYFWSQT